MYSRNIPMAGKRIVCFQSKKVKRCSFFISNNYYIYIWRDILKKIVTNDFKYILEDSCFKMDATGITLDKFKHYTDILV